MKTVIDTVPSRYGHLCIKKGDNGPIPQCNKASIPGTVTQRSCVYGGARVILMPITNAIHLVHGPIGCAACTWDIRGSKSSTYDLYKSGFSTDLHEEDIVFGGEKKLSNTLIELNSIYNPAAIFVYSTCIAGVIGDDIKKVCDITSKLTGSKIIPVQSEGFRSFNKSLGHQIACDAMLDYLIGTGRDKNYKFSSNSTKEDEFDKNYTINIVGEFNIAGDLWAIKRLFKSMNIKIISSITGDSCVEDIAHSHLAKLNIVQCQKSSNYLARKMEKIYGIPHFKVNFFGIEETSESLRAVARFFNDQVLIEKTEEIIEYETINLRNKLKFFKDKLRGKTVAVYVGGNKAWSLIRAFEELGMEVVMTGTQNGIPEDYDMIKSTVSDGTLVVDDANTIELTNVLKKIKPNLMVSGAKEKYLSLKLGIPFCDFNHDRVTSFAGFEGFLNFAKEVEKAVSNQVLDLDLKIK